MRQPIFTFNNHINGSYIDSVSGTVGTPTNGEFKRTTKGLSFKLDSSTSLSYTLSSFDAVNLITMAGGNGTLRVTIGSTNTDISLTNWSFDKTVLSLTGETTVTFSCTSGTVYLSRCLIFDDSISVDEENSLEKQFLRAGPITKGNAGTKLVKPSNYITNLENEEGLVAAYNFNKDTVKTDKVLDISGNQNDGTYNGNPLLTKDGLKFDGVDDFVEYLQITHNKSAFSLLFRYKDNDISSLLPFVGFDTAVYSFLELNGTLLVLESDTNNDNVVVTVVRDTLWHTLVVTVENDNVIFYQDGNVIGTGVINDDLTINRLGRDRFASHANAVFTDFRSYNRPLSEQEIKDYHNSFVDTVVKESFEDNAVGETAPLGWLNGQGTGDYEVEEYSIEQGELSGDLTTYAKSDEITVTPSGFEMLSADGSVILLYKDLLTVGKKYRFRFYTEDSKVTTGSCVLKYLESSGVITTDINGNLISDVGWHTVEKTLIYTGSGSGRVQFQFFSPTIGDYWNVSNVSVTEIPPLPTINSGTKLLTNTSAGVNAFQSNTAYGEWEFDVYKSTESTTPEINIMNTESDAEGDGYAVLMNIQERIGLYRVDGGTLTFLFYTPINYIAPKTWYGIKVTRTPDGEFTVYIKGGSFGDEYQLVDTTGGSGTNPVVDNTYTTSNYFVTDLDESDSITSIRIKNGVKR